MAEEPRWYVIHTYSGYENKVASSIEKAVEKRLGLPVYKPKNPMFVTPLGIALSCKQEEMW